MLDHVAVISNQDVAMSEAVRGRVTFANVTKMYGAVAAVEDTSFAIEPGQLVTLLGPSGCGKTTTLRMIAGLELPNRGKITIGSTDVTTLSATYRNVAMVFQSYALFPHMSVIENVSYGLRVSGMPKSESFANAEVAMEMVGLAGYGKRLPSELSGGQQQRVAVARAVVLNPEVLLLDEPLSNLDAKLRRHVREEIRALQQRLKLTTVYVTHDQEEAMAVSDRIIVMDKGRIAQDGTPRELYESPKSSFIAGFIGEANIFDCQVLKSGRSSKVAFAGIEFEINQTGIAVGPAKLIIRSSSIRLGDGPLPAIEAQLTSAAYLGDRILYGLMTKAGRLFHTEPSSNIPLEPGSNVRLQLDISQLRLTKS